MYVVLLSANMKIDNINVCISQLNMYKIQNWVERSLGKWFLFMSRHSPYNRFCSKTFKAGFHFNAMVYGTCSNLLWNYDPIFYFKYIKFTIEIPSELRGVLFDMMIDGDKLTHHPNWYLVMVMLSYLKDNTNSKALISFMLHIHTYKLT